MSGTSIVHSYSPKKELLRRVLGALALVVTLSLAAASGLFAFSHLRAEPAPKLPKLERVVKVNVQPER